MKKKSNTKLYEWQKNAEHNVCVKCGENRHITVDHIIPVFIVEQLTLSREESYNFEDNFQYLCRYCNHEKSAQIDVRNPKTFMLMRELLDKSEKYFITHNDPTPTETK